MKLIDNNFSMKCVACIVVYNPDIERLEKNIAAVSKQVDKVYCYDNASSNHRKIKEIVQKFSNCICIKDNHNVGIAMAVNRVADIAKKQNYEWMLTLDQDSICPPNMISSFGQYSNIKRIGIICPRYIDIRRPDEKKDVSDDYTMIDFCITSGSLMNINVFFEIGKMDEYLFIGSIDDEYCYRLIKNEYNILRVNYVKLDHELGMVTPSKLKELFLFVGKIFNSSKLQALSYKRDVSPIRVYYATRNIVYLSKKYDSALYKFSKKYAIYNGLSCVLRAKHKILVFKEFMRGFLDGYKS